MNTVHIDTSAIPKIEVKILCSTVLEAVKRFVEDPANATLCENARRYGAFEAFRMEQEAKRVQI